MIAELRERLAAQAHIQLLVVRMTIAQRINPAELIFYTLRRLTQELSRNGVLAVLDGELRATFEASVLRTSSEIKRTRS